MRSTPSDLEVDDPTEQADECLDSEQSEAKKQVKSETIRAAVMLIFLALLIVGGSHLFHWFLHDEKLLPSSQEIADVLGILTALLILGYVSARFSAAQRIRDRRLIRLEMKINMILDRQEDL